MPKNVIRHSFNPRESCHSNLQALMVKLEKFLSDGKKGLIVDSFDGLVSGLDSSSPELDLVEFVNSMPAKYTIVFNRDLLEPLPAQFLRSIKQSCDFLFSIDSNTAGYSHDVHGQLNVTCHSQPTHNIKFRLAENGVKLFT